MLYPKNDNRHNLLLSLLSRIIQHCSRLRLEKLRSYHSDDLLQRQLDFQV